MARVEFTPKARLELSRPLGGHLASGFCRFRVPGFGGFGFQALGGLGFQVLGFRLLWLRLEMARNSGGAS